MSSHDSSAYSAMTQDTWNEPNAEAVWLQLEIYTTGENASSAAMSALRGILDRLEAGDTLGVINDGSGKEIGWFDARPDNDATR